MKEKPSINRRDFLKGVGIAGGGALFSFLVGNETESVQAREEQTHPLAQPQELNSPDLVTAYLLETEGMASGYFTYCTNMGSTHDSVEHKVVDENYNEVIRVIPGRLHYNDIILERGLTHDTSMWDWLEEVGSDFQNARKNGSIFVLNQSGEPVARWDFFNAWPREVYATLLPSDEDPEIVVYHEHVVLVVEEIYKPE